MKKLTLLFLLLIVFQFTNAQESKIESYVITEDGARIEMHPGSMARGVLKGKSKLEFVALVQKKGKTKTKNMKIANFQKEIDGKQEAKIISIDGKKPRVYLVNAESNNHLMLTTLWVGKYNSHTYYHLVTKNTHKLVIKGEFGHGSRKKYKQQEKSYTNLLRKYKLKNQVPPVKYTVY